MKNISYLLFFLISFNTVIAQVGIGTTNPDPSSVLDIDSTEGGLLVPRMETVDRLAISSPATGLLVFDIDENAFFYYDGASWEQQGTVEKRDNYKLVKSEADLADELSAGGNTSYMLDTNTLYEINGTIEVLHPITLNGAYVEGVDIGEDVIRYNPTSSTDALFTGTVGGSLRNVTIDANSNTVFDITAATPGTGSVAANSVVFRNASSIGSIEDVFAVFFNVGQYVNCSTGITLTDVFSTTFENTFWSASCSGTFLTLNGTLTNFQANNGRIEVDSGETGMDVSSNPTVTNVAVVEGISFVGAGNYINGYTVGSYSGYNFTNNWDVDSPGIPLETDRNATGDLNFNFTAGGGASTTFTANQTPVKLNGATTSNSLFRFSRSGDNRIVYEGNQTRFFNVTASISFEGNTSQDRYIFYIAKGNSGDATPTVVDETGVWRRISGIFDIGAVPLIGTIELSQGDYIEVWAERFSGTGSLFTVALNLSIR